MKGEHGSFFMYMSYNWFSNLKLPNYPGERCRRAVFRNGLEWLPVDCRAAVLARGKDMHCVRSLAVSEALKRRP